VAQVEGVNSHQVFDGRWAYRNGRLDALPERSAAVLPVILEAMNNAIEADANGMQKPVVAPAAVEPAVAAGRFAAICLGGLRSVWSMARTAHCCARCSPPLQAQVATCGRSFRAQTATAWLNRPHHRGVPQPTLRLSGAELPQISS